MKRFTLFLLIASACFSTSAQVTPEQLEEMQKKLQKQRDSVFNLPHVKKYLENPESAKLPLPGPAASTPKIPKATALDKLELPPKDSARLKRIPNKTFSPEELQNYCTDLHNQIARKLPQTTVDKVNRMFEEIRSDISAQETAAALAFNAGQDEEAVLIITQAASNSGDGALLTNAGAILDMAGLSDKAIPILKTVVQNSTNNMTALNNLGQAYTSLGQHDSALHYFSRCLSISPEHPEANNTAGVIELKRGNNARAEKHFENSIRGGFNISAYSGLKHIRKEKTRIAHLIHPKIKMPEYFNQFKYKLPRQLLNVMDAADVEEEHARFKAELDQAVRFYQALAKEAEVAFAKITPQQRNAAIMKKINNGESYVRPFQVLAGILEAETMLQYNDDVRDLEYFNKVNRQQYKDLELEYKKKYDVIWKKYNDKEDDCCGEGDLSCCDNNFCVEMDALKNEYLPKFAALNTEYQSRNLQIEIKHLDNFLYWGFFAAMDRDEYKLRFYTRVVNYLRTLQRLEVMKIFKPCRLREEGEEKEKEEKKKPVKSMDCPISFQLPVGVLKVSLDCEAFSITAGKGLYASYKKNFVSRQSTWIFGVGTEPDLTKRKFKYGEFDVKIGMSVFLSFDQAGNLSDGGLAAQAAATSSFGLGFEGGEKLKFKQAVGWRLGINTGLTLSQGKLKDLIDKIGPAPEKQVNKNIKIYKSGQ